MLKKMRSIDEGGSSRLKNSMVLCGSLLRDGNKHEPKNVPTVLAGQDGGSIKAGRHLEFEKGTPLCNLWVSMLDRVGAPVKKFADSTGEAIDRLVVWGCPGDSGGQLRVTELQAQKQFRYRRSADCCLERDGFVVRRRASGV